MGGTVLWAGTLDYIKWSELSTIIYLFLQCDQLLQNLTAMFLVTMD